MTSKWTSFKVAIAAFGLLALGALIPSMFSERVSAQFADQSTFVISSRVSGTGNAVVLQIPNVVNLNQILGVPVRFLPGANSVAGGATVQINSLTAHAADRITGNGLVPISGGDFQTGMLAEVMWDGTEFIHKNPAAGNDNVGTEINLTNGVPLGFLPESGTCVSQTTYAALYAYYGSTDLWLTQAGGVACSAGQFHLPFANGRAAFAPDTMNSVTAGILTSGGSSCGATAVAVGCGFQNYTILQNRLPNIVPTFTGTQQTWNLNQQVTAAILAAASGGAVDAGNGNFTATVTVTPAGTISSINGGVTQQPLTTIPTLYTVNKAVRY